MRLDGGTILSIAWLLKDKGYLLSLQSLLICRTSLGWTFRGSSYSQLIRETKIFTMPILEVTALTPSYLLVWHIPLWSLFYAHLCKKTGMSSTLFRWGRQWFSWCNLDWWMHNSATDPQTESPDTNPNKNLWHELKEYVRIEVKPLNQLELVTGIINFWKSVEKKCTGHLRKVLPKIIELAIWCSNWIIIFLTFFYVVNVRFYCLSNIDCQRWDFLRYYGHY